MSVFNGGLNLLCEFRYNFIGLDSDPLLIGICASFLALFGWGRLLWIFTSVVPDTVDQPRGKLLSLMHHAEICSFGKAWQLLFHLTWLGVTVIPSLDHYMLVALSEQGEICGVMLIITSNSHQVYPFACHASCKYSQGYLWVTQCERTSMLEIHSCTCLVMYSLRKSSCPMDPPRYSFPFVMMDRLVPLKIPWDLSRRCCFTGIWDLDALGKFPKAGPKSLILSHHIKGIACRHRLHHPHIILAENPTSAYQSREWWI